MKDLLSDEVGDSVSLLDTGSSRLAARRGYDLAAAYYEKWEWQKFWRLNETPTILRLIAELPNIDKFLDVGAGTGYYMHLLSGTGRSVVGVDISDRMLRNARMRLGHKSLLVQADACRLPFRDNGFDMILATRVLSHIRSLENVFVEFRRVVREGGYILVSDVDEQHDYECTYLPTRRGKIAIETYKHNLTDLSRAAELWGLRTQAVHQITADNSRWLPSLDSIDSIDRTGKRPIGFIALLRRCL